MTDGPVWIDRVGEAEVEDRVATAIGRLAGQRIAVKDNIDVEGFDTTAGCPAFAYRPTKTATAVQRLIDEGAVVAGKTNMDQFATGLVGTRSPHGVVENPCRPGFIAGGSSSGSAAAVALGQADLGLATDTAGSGRVPAALCGLVGLKGTRGWVSTRGVVPACPSFDCTTVMARTLHEAVAAMRVMAGPDRSDPHHRTRPPGLPPAVRRIGVAEPDSLGCDEITSSGYRHATEQLIASGFELVVVDLEPYFRAGHLLYGGSFVAERLASVGEFLAGDPPGVDPVVASVFAGASTLTAAAYAADRHLLAHLERDAATIWDAVDAVALPTVPFHPTVDQVRAEPVRINLDLGRYVSGANLVDWCGAIVPTRLEPVPFGLQLLGPAWADEAIWAAAATLLGLSLTTPIGPDRVRVAVLGAHLHGQPLHHQLADRGASPIRTCRTAPAYRMVLLDGALPKPGLLRDAEVAASIEVEVFELDHLGFGQLVAEVPAPLAIGTVELDDGSTVHGFLCESESATSAPDISAFGGWRAWLARSE